MLRALRFAWDVLRAVLEPPPVVPCACGSLPVLPTPRWGNGYRYYCPMCGRKPLQRCDNEQQARLAWRAFTEHQRRMS